MLCDGGSSVGRAQSTFNSRSSSSPSIRMRQSKWTSSKSKRRRRAWCSSSRCGQNSQSAILRRLTKGGVPGAAVAAWCSLACPPLQHICGPLPQARGLVPQKQYRAPVAPIPPGSRAPRSLLPSAWVRYRSMMLCDGGSSVGRAQSTFNSRSSSSPSIRMRQSKWTSSKSKRRRRAWCSGSRCGQNSQSAILRSLTKGGVPGAAVAAWCSLACPPLQHICCPLPQARGLRWQPLQLGAVS